MFPSTLASRGGMFSGAKKALLKKKRSGVALPPTLNMETWFRKNIGITSAANAVSNWANQAVSGAARDEAQATGAAQPTLQGDGTILFNGTSHFLSTAAFTLVQPFTVYIRIKPITWANSNVIFGDGAAVTVLQQSTASPTVAMYGGTALAPTGALALGAFSSICCVYNGAASVLNINGAETVGNPGASSLGNGLVLGAIAGGASRWSNVQIAEAISYSAAHDAATRAAVLAYLNTR